jgi:hypothetical protein
MSHDAQAVSPDELLEPARVPESSGARFAVRANVLAARTRDTLVLLDRANDRYVTLNDVAAEIWSRLSEGMAPDSIVEILCSHYDAPRDQVRADVYAQVAEFVRTGLIERKTMNHTPVPAEVSAARHASTTGHANRTAARRAATSLGEFRPSSYLKCAAVIAAIKFRLAMQGFDRTIRWIRRQIDGVPVTEHAAMEAVRAEECGVAMAAALYPGRAQCLERSLALYLLLRRRGVAVRYRQGVQPFPFKAHAWIEYQGEVINDVPEHAGQFTPLPECLL